MRTEIGDLEKFIDFLKSNIHFLSILIFDTPSF
jgi:hypothetical protein